MVSIVLIEDHKIIRQGLKELLETEPDFQVVGEAGNGRDGVELTAQLKPDIVLSDLMMNGMDGFQVVHEIRRLSEGTQTIILSVMNDAVCVSRALHEGARGYVLKELGIDELIMAIRQVLNGAIYVCPSLKRNGHGQQLSFEELDQP